MIVIRFDAEISVEEMKETVYLNYHPVYSQYPDHVFKGAWDIFCREYMRTSGHWLLPTLKSLADDFLCFKHGRLHVGLMKFGEWQELSGQIDSMAARAGAHVWGIAKRGGSRDMPPSREPEKIASAEFLARPWDPAVEDYIAREGLHETHLHLNGSTHVALCWQRALREPESELREFSKKFYASNSMGVKVRELCRAVDPDLTPLLLWNSLKDARAIRAWLILWVENTAIGCPANLATLRNTSPILPDGIKARLNAAEETARIAEWEWMTKVLAELDRNPHRAAEQMLHIYLLKLNRFRQLLVQRVDMVGFDQFQKYTYTDLRDGSEKKYYDRFQQMHGNSQHSRQHWIEGRLAPKNTVDKNADLLFRALCGYSLYLKAKDVNAISYGSMVNSLTGVLDRLDQQINDKGVARIIKLALVMHFPKTEHKSTDSSRHSELRRNLEAQAGALRETLIRWPKLRKWLRGIDAAANEFHAPPEVFAPIFRFCSRSGLTHRTYHVGEDFPHLISGIRHVVDALELLDLQNGDRIGHGTAIGIQPDLWISRMPSEVVVTQGGWVLDLLCAWKLLRDNIKLSAIAAHLERELVNVAADIFGKYHTALEIERVMAQRSLMPKYVFQALEVGDGWSWKNASFNDAWREEARLVSDAIENRQDLELLKIWWSDKQVMQRCDKVIRVPAEFLKSKILLLLQQSVLASVRDRHVIIETLPTSNVRISQYRSFFEHHSLRWMKVPGFRIKGDPDIMISLGSDDPGIFCNDLNTDFYQLYGVMRESGINDIDALSFLAKANERGRQYRFHSPGV